MISYRSILHDSTQLGALHEVAQDYEQVTIIESHGLGAVPQQRKIATGSGEVSLAFPMVSLITVSADKGEIDEILHKFSAGIRGAQ